MPIAINTVDEPVIVTPTPPTTATSAQVSAHATAVQSVIKTLESLPQTADNAEAYLSAKAESLTTWVTTKHAKTRIIETILITAALSCAITYFLCRL